MACCLRYVTGLRHVKDGAAVKYLVLADAIFFAPVGVILPNLRSRLPCTDRVVPHTTGVSALGV